MCIDHISFVVRDLERVLRVWERHGACFVHPRESEGILIELDPSAPPMGRA